MLGSSAPTVLGRGGVDAHVPRQDSADLVGGFLGVRRRDADDGETDDCPGQNTANGCHGVNVLSGSSFRRTTKSAVDVR